MHMSRSNPIPVGAPSDLGESMDVPIGLLGLSSIGTAGVDFARRLEDLTSNSLPIIQALTLYARDHESSAKDLARVLENTIRRVTPSQKLVYLYLLDSIVKNAAGVYPMEFSRNLVFTFSQAFEQAEPSTRNSYVRLLRTWTLLFPADKIRLIEQRLRALKSLDPVILRELDNLWTPPPPSATQQRQRAAAAPGGQPPQHQAYPSRSSRSHSSRQQQQQQQQFAGAPVVSASMLSGAPVIAASPPYYGATGPVSPQLSPTRSSAKLFVPIPPAPVPPPSVSSTAGPLSELEGLLRSGHLAPLYSNPTVGPLLSQLTHVISNPSAAAPLAAQLLSSPEFQHFMSSMSSAPAPPSYFNPQLPIPLPPAPMPSQIISTPSYLGPITAATPAVPAAPTPGARDLILAMLSKMPVGPAPPGSMSAPVSPPLRPSSPPSGSLSSTSSFELAQSLFFCYKQQCKHCGMRLPTAEDLKSHTAEHEKEEHRLNSLKETCRKYYQVERDWMIKPDPLPFDSSVALVFKSTASGGAEGSSSSMFDSGKSEEELEQERRIKEDLPADDSQDTCPVCSEMFDSYWDENRQEWMYQSVMRRESDNHLVHRSCAVASGELKQESLTIPQPLHLYPQVQVPMPMPPVQEVAVHSIKSEVGVVKQEQVVAEEAVVVKRETHPEEEDRSDVKRSKLS